MSIKVFSSSDSITPKNTRPEFNFVLPLSLAILSLFNFAFYASGFTFTCKQLDFFRSLIGYLLPLAFYFAIKRTTDFRFKSVLVKISFLTMLLSIAALLIDFWGGQLNFLGRLSEPLKEGQSYRSDINTWHTVIQMRHLKSEDVQVVLEMVVEKGIEPVKTIELKYIRSMGQFVKQSKLVCSGLSYSDARFEVDEQKGNVILIATPKGQKDKIEKVLSTDFTRVKPCLLCP